MRFLVTYKPLKTEIMVTERVPVWLLTLSR